MHCQTLTHKIMLAIHSETCSTSGMISGDVQSLTNWTMVYLRSDLTARQGHIAFTDISAQRESGRVTHY